MKHYIERNYTVKEGIAKKGDNYLSTFKYETETIHIIKHNRIKIIDFVKRSKKKQLSPFFSRPLLCQ